MPLSSSDRRGTRVLILTSSTGSGHDMRAQALKAWIEKDQSAGAVDVRVEHLIERASWIGRFGVWVYNTIQRYAPFLHHVYWHIVEVFSAAHQKSVTYGGRYYRDLVREYRPTLIVSVHDSLNRGYFEDARRVLEPDSVRCVTYSGEWSGGYGFSRNWVNPSADMFYSRTAAALDAVEKLGLPRSRCRVFTNLLPPRDFKRPLTEEEKLEFRRDTLHLDPSRFTVFLSTGAFGANHHLRFLRVLKHHADRVQAIIVCGRNVEIYEKLCAWRERNPELKLFVEGFSKRMDRFLQVSDAVVTRGGSNTAAEALYFGCPLLFNRFGGLMPQELLTVNYFTSRGAAVTIRSLKHFDEVVRSWSRRDEAYLRVKQNMQALQASDHPRGFVQELLQAPSIASTSADGQADDR